eukprot:780455-Pleurochrysis_carterae.AAC.1
MSGEQLLNRVELAEKLDAQKAQFNHEKSIVDLRALRAIDCARQARHRFKSRMLGESKRAHASADAMRRRGKQ